jgi:predicted transcriptional regulator
MKAAEWRGVVATLGASVRELRRLIGWSQQHVADRALVSQGCVSRMEAGRCDQLPFRSVVAVLRTLGTAAIQLDLTPTPLTQQLLVFTDSLAGPVALVDPDPDLAAIVQQCTHMAPSQRALFRRFVRSAAALAASKETPDADAALPAVGHG